jgi:ubiquinone/menaquinone biosynthesis C-methylase UbiE
MGHYPVAVDLLTNTLDGLGAAQHFRGQMPELFPRVQAEHDRLPFATASFDLVIFNASFHYSENYERTLREAFRCIHLSGAVVIADTPFYAEDASGLAMIEERRRLFQTRFSFPSDSIASLEYLTHRRLDELSAELGIHWQIYKPWYGLRWALRPWLARLRRHREPSRFYLYVAQAA